MCALFLFGCNTGKKTLSNSQITEPADVSLTNTYWKLTELMGQPVSPADNDKREMHLTLRKEGNTVTGHGGCNSFRGTYTMGTGMQIKFSQMASTLMACANMEKEKEFMDILSKTDNYAIKENVLSLNRARMAPLAKFVAVYMK
jgi:heat shock protein HslJ